MLRFGWVSKGGMGRLMVTHSMSGLNQWHFIWALSSLIDKAISLQAIAQTQVIPLQRPIANTFTASGNNSNSTPPLSTDSNIDSLSGPLFHYLCASWYYSKRSFLTVIFQAQQDHRHLVYFDPRCSEWWHASSSGLPIAYSDF